MCWRGVAGHVGYISSHCSSSRRPMRSLCVGRGHAKGHAITFIAHFALLGTNMHAVMHTHTQTHTHTYTHTYTHTHTHTHTHNLTHTNKTYTTTLKKRQQNTTTRTHNLHPQTQIQNTHTHTHTHTHTPIRSSHILGGTLPGIIKLSCSIGLLWFIRRSKEYQ